MVPVYFTMEDYDDKFELFRGSRFFELTNVGPVDVEFTHYGFGSGLERQGFTVEQVGVPEGTFRVEANSKATFRVGFNLDQTFQINSTNRLVHHSVTMYLYKGNSYHIQLHLVMKVAENILAKMKAKSEEKQFKSTSSWCYLCLNAISFIYICIVILQLKKEEEDKQTKLQLLKEKVQKISVMQP